MALAAATQIGGRPMKQQSKVCGVLLFEEAYSALGEAIAPYVKTGPVGKFIYCASAVQNGVFLEMTSDPEHCDDSVRDCMVISVPLNFIRLVATATEKRALPAGFTS